MSKPAGRYGSAWAKTVMKDFQWNPSLSRDDFAINIPDNYTCIGTMEHGEANEDVIDLMTIQQSCAFYANLESADHDPAYYGEDVKSADFDAVLLRWRLEDGRYRVVFGDLRSVTVGAAELTELEK